MNDMTLIALFLGAFSLSLIVSTVILCLKLDDAYIEINKLKLDIKQKDMA